VGAVRRDHQRPRALLLHHLPLLQRRLLLALIALGTPWCSGAADALNRSELVVIYVMLTISTSMADDAMQVLLGVMTWGWWYATPLNGASTC
jgi:hypothetical protein